MSTAVSALALKLLGLSRLELRSSTIERLGQTDPGRLAALTLVDAGLALQLFNQQFCLFRYVEMARVTGVPMEYLLTRGQSIKVFSMLLRKALAHNYVMPPQSRGGSGEDSYEGATVLEPLSGFYDEPIITLDFASLYPSIMQRHNLCYSTLLKAGQKPTAVQQSSGDGAAADDDGVELVPSLGHRFVKGTVRKGLLPMVLEELLTARATAKKALKAAADAQMKAVLDGRQLALKISANSVYGFTGMSVGQLPCQAIAASVTAYGRQMLEHTKSTVESKFCQAVGSRWDAKVIYGDTDSVMITLGKDTTLEEAFDFGKEAAVVVSKEFGPPVKMEFEKVYFPFLLMNKKRYAGRALASADQPGKVGAKGIEVVRRDWCDLTRQVIQQSLDLLLKARSPADAESYVRETVSALRQGKVDMGQLVISKGLVRAGSEEYKSKLPHVELAEKLRKRSPATAPQIGDRVAYVYTVGAAGAPGYEKAEDPLYALQNGMQIDADYYFEHQLEAPLLRIFEPVLGKEPGDNAAKKRLFGAGDRSRKVVISKNHGMAQFTRRRAKCVGCSALLPPGSEAALCDICGQPDKKTKVVLDRVAAMRPLEAEASRLRSTCVACEGSVAGSLHTECVNVDCPIFFRRVHVATELSDMQAVLHKFRLDW
eukprot:TRINITY_DN14374_c0_g1_i12.p1 TRINITY_DN14374_c0_g1~~TRINITY_DN14374_c0_g1_i12.p1  ORF type:complete len:654 (+),score=142.80 TRINITY_DN14374_c0_g1_i12:929-2890(+)